MVSISSLLIAYVRQILLDKVCYLLNFFYRLRSVLKTKIAITSFLLIVAIISRTSNLFASTYYVCDTDSSCGSEWAAGNDSNVGTSKTAAFKTISHGVSKLAARDTLIVGDGIYAGASNTINSQTTGIQPVSGSPSAYTTIKAEHDGGVLITYTNSAGIKILGNENIDATEFNPDSGSSKQNYIMVRGFIVSGSTIAVEGAKYIKIINCGSVDAWDGNNVNMGTAFSEYILFEGCYAWGSGRYKFLSFHSRRSIFRNCVGRLDYAAMQANEYDPVATFSMYSSTDIEVQNCIDIDSDTEKWGSTGALQIERPYGAFFNPSTSATIYNGPIIWTNCIALNNKLGFGASDYNNYAVDARYRNCIGWALAPTSNANYQSTPVDIIHSQGSLDLEQSTIGAVILLGASNYLWNGWKPGNTQVSKNNIFYDIVNPTAHNLFYDIETLTYNDIYGSGTSPYAASGTEPSNTITSNPVSTSNLKYLPRLESGSSLKTAGESDSRIGAEILFQYGKSGTLYGEAGYNLLQDGTDGQNIVRIWPFPNEDLIKTKMATYANHSINGTRGFCASGKTLTNYIWGYLGNILPPFNVKISAGNQKVILSWDPNTYDNGVKGYKIYKGTSSGSYILDQVVTGTTGTITGLVNYEPYYFVITTDGEGGESGYSYQVSATPKLGPEAPIVNGTTPTNDTSPTWSWISGGGGNGIYRYNLGGDPSGDGDTSTTFTPSAPLSNGTYTLYVQEGDAAGNWSSSGFSSITIDATADVSNDSGGGGGGCFIATAAYGSLLEPHVKILREFRDVYLLHSEFGRAFVNLYYKYSPPIANVIAKHDFMRAIVRWGLVPIVIISYFALHAFTLKKITFMTLIVLAAMGSYVAYYRNGQKAQLRG
jgi:hypothetical protein